MKKDDKIQVGIIGGGETGAAIFKNFLKYKFIEIVGVADNDENSPAMVMAREMGIYTSTDFLDIAKMDVGVDVIIDAVGKEVIRKGIRTYLQATSNDTTILMPELISLMFEAMLNGRDSIQKGKHGFQKY